MKIALPVARPPWNGLGDELESACRKAIYDFALLENVQKVAVALSGGKDSLSLLYLLHALRGRGFPLFDLVAIHVRGEFSCGAGIDKGFLQGICEELQVPLVVQNSTIKQDNLECYSCSRDRRKQIFEAAKKLGATTVAFGHHRDDNAQTLLLNLLHKAEFAAALPKLHMQRYGVTIIRPLIYIKEESLKIFARQLWIFAHQLPMPGRAKLQKKKSGSTDQRYGRGFSACAKQFSSRGSFAWI